MKSAMSFEIGIFLLGLGIYYIGAMVTFEYLLFYEKGKQRSEDNQKSIALAWPVVVPVMIALSLWKRWEK